MPKLNERLLKIIRWRPVRACSLPHIFSPAGKGKPVPCWPSFCPLLNLRHSNLHLDVQLVRSFFHDFDTCAFACFPHPPEFLPYGRGDLRDLMQFAHSKKWTFSIVSNGKQTNVHKAWSATIWDTKYPKIRASEDGRNPVVAFAKAILKFDEALDAMYEELATIFRSPHSERT